MTDLQPAGVQWKYKRGGDKESRVKHRWKNDYPGFDPDCTKAPVGKCPCHVTEEIAQEALNHGVPFYADEESEAAGGFPDKIFGLYQGVIYEAVVTDPGQSFHAYPWREIPGRKSIPRRILNRLEQQLSTEEDKTTFKKWLKRYSA